MDIFNKFKSGLSKSSKNLSLGLNDLIFKKKIDENILNELEDFLIQSDVGVESAKELKEKFSNIKINPKNSEKGYYIESGWASSASDNLKLPLDTTIWKIKGNKILKPNNPVTLEWDNNVGLIFSKKIELDNRLLFKITQSIKNNSNKSFQFFPYAQITRNYKPEITPIYILHEGFIGVFGEELQEKDYKDIDKEKYTVNASKGWLGITDKYWLTAIVREGGKNFKSEFVSSNGKYRANFIIKESEILNDNS